MPDGNIDSGETLVPNWAPKEAGKTPTKFRLDALPSDENAAVPLNINRKTVYYKRHISESERRWVSYHRGERSQPLSPVTSLTKDEALKIADKLNLNYKNFKAAFGDHVADTQFIVGSSRDEEGKDMGNILVQAVQEGVRVFPHSNLYDAIKGITNKELDNLFREAKGKTLQELRESNNPHENELARIISYHLPALHDFYRAYIEAALLGVIPDLKYWPDPDKRTRAHEAGLLFSDNIGIVSDKQGREKVVIFDFGSPRKLIKLSPEARQRLKNLIDQKRSGNKPELPIILKREFVESKYDDYHGASVQIASWFENALREELEEYEYDSLVNFLERVFQRRHSNKKDARYEDLPFNDLRFRSGVEAPTDKLRIDPMEGLEWEDYNFIYELEAWSKLTGAPLYATEVVVQYDSSGEREVRRFTPEIYLKVDSETDQSIKST
ncbi:hypothetical protein A3J20_01875 [Candidatus Gottesmanbacteria bacterium RIFCSPLOWO2_02_FULL_42_29]|nr:MAG: hypothetical protein A3E72_02840 [Candidatus Gottesmanbacteria bacterium RIFCSPHIGHO2_12_FULL_43_26]OGG36522.1 MAG: hypothetical protein A3J20_01875 [Candidatus Gottesmanbacteria bacterium RIFCSPLOWO2_02_FULL_42_29]